MSGNGLESTRRGNRARIAAGVVGSIVGLAAAGVAAGIAGQRALLRRAVR
jgi:hypothetical protein